MHRCLLLLLLLLLHGACKVNEPSLDYQPLKVENRNPMLKQVIKDKSFLSVDQKANLLSYYNRYDNKWTVAPLNDNSITKGIEDDRRGEGEFDTLNLVSGSDFGISSNNVDNTHLIQKALDYCALEGKSLLLPNGIIKTRTIKLNCSLVGSGSTVLMLEDSANAPLIEIGKERNVRLVNFVLDGNRENQLELKLTQNFNGLAKNSLVRVSEGFKSINISNCVFRNSIQGGIAIQNVDGEADGNLVVETCLFSNLRTEGLRYYGCRIDRSSRFSGSLSVSSSRFRDIGIRLDEPIGKLSSFGNAIVTGNLSKSKVEDCHFENTARFNVKTGVIDYIELRGNLSYNAGWGHFQTQTSALGKAYQALGRISISDEIFVSNQIDEKPLFAQFKGSLLKEANHSIYPYLLVKHCQVFYLNEKNNHISDCVQITGYGKYSHAHFEGNYCYGVRRGFVMVSLPVLDDFQMKELVLERNEVIGRGQSATTANSLLYIQAAKDRSSNAIHLVKISKNKVREVQSALFLQSDPVENLHIWDNEFDNHHGASVYFLHGTSRLKELKMENNNMSGGVRR